MAAAPKPTHRPNIYIEATPEAGYTIAEGPDRRQYRDLHEACDADDRFRQAYTHLKAGVHALQSGKVRPTGARQLNPFCRALSGKFVSDGREARISIFTKAGNAGETIVAVQVTARTAEGQHVDFYTTHPRQHRMVDPFLRSLQTFVNSESEDLG